MCGIAGMIHSNKDAALEAVRAMNAAQRHRGPDDEGLESFQLTAGTLALGHRRLSILDLSPAGHQPMSNPITGDWIVFNGEIYNFLELRAELEKCGDVFRSRCDTEVILKTYARWGAASFEKLHGMFAFALFDARKNELILARDPLGIKPLYYTWQAGGGFAFASEVRALKAAGVDCGQIDPRAIAGLLAYGAVQEPLTMYAGVKALPAGTWAAVNLAEKSSTFSRQGRHWDFPQVRESIGERAALLTDLRGRLSHAARSHLISDVPVGIFLSGGIDSTAIAALSAESHQALNAFSVRLADRPDLDESVVAAESAKALGLRHHIIDLTENAILAEARDWLASQDQPSMDGLNTYAISKAVRERGIVVALSGLGGDEIFGGYPSFRDVPKMIKWRRRTGIFPATLLKLAASAAYARKSQAQRQKAVEMATTAPELVPMFFRRRRMLTDSDMRALGFDARKLNLTPEFLPPESEPGRGLPAHDPVAAISLLESRFYMGNTLLRDSDCCAMAHGLEIRVPLLDRGVIDLAFALPGALRVPPHSRTPNKPLIVDALGASLPQHVLNLKKRGFNLSQPLWMRGPLREYFDAALSSVKNSGWMEAQPVDQIWQRFLDSGTGPDWARPWTLGVLGAWKQLNT